MRYCFAVVMWTHAQDGDTDGQEHKVCFSANGIINDYVRMRQRDSSRDSTCAITIIGRSKDSLTTRNAFSPDFSGNVDGDCGEEAHDETPSDTRAA